ncbi:MAG: helix-turn-helix domain-containing protein [Bacilli bacterium]
MEEKTVGQMISEAREKKGLSKNQLGELAGVSHTEISRIESGEREIPNPKTLRKISKHIDVNYNDLMYAAGLGMQVTPLNPFLKRYYSTLKGTELDEALINTLGSIDNWNALVKSLQKRLDENDILENEKEVILQTIEDTEYQINSANEIVKLLHSAKTKERVENERKD